MKGKKCFGLLLALSIIFGLSSSVFLENSSAVSYSDSQYKSLSGASIYYANGGSLAFVLNSRSGGAYWAGSGVNNTSGFNYLALRFSGTIPANSLVSLVVKVAAPTGTYPQVGWTTRSSAYSLVDSTYGEYGTNYLLFYVDSAVSGEIDLFAVNFPTVTSLDVELSPISYTVLESVPSSSQIVQLQNTLNEINAKSGTTNGNLEIIRGKLDDIMSNSDRTADAVEEQNERDQEDRDNMESQQSDSQSGADESQADAESTGTTLLGAFTGFVGALTSATPSNCNIDMDLGNLDLGVVNLCQLSLPQPFPTIASIMLILFCVPLSIATAKKVINLFRSFQG